LFFEAGGFWWLFWFFWFVFLFFWLFFWFVVVVFLLLFFGFFGVFFCCFSFPLKGKIKSLTAMLSVGQLDSLWTRECPGTPTVSAAGRPARGVHVGCPWFFCLFVFFFLSSTTIYAHAVTCRATRWLLISHPRLFGRQAPSLTSIAFVIFFFFFLFFTEYVLLTASLQVKIAKGRRGSLGFSGPLSVGGHTQFQRGEFELVAVISENG
jgi:hypothetical protein